MSEPSWRYAERSPSLPPARPERREQAADTFGGLYRTRGSVAASHEWEGRAAARTGRRGAPGGRAERRPSRGWGKLPAGIGVLIVLIGAGAGAAATIATASEPGTMLGAALVAGSVAGVFAVRANAAYRLVPVPALTGIAAALLAGLVHDRAVDSSHTQLAINALGWMSGGFASVAAATGVTLVIALMRLVWHARRRWDSDDGYTDDDYADDGYADAPWGGRPGR